MLEFSFVGNQYLGTKTDYIVETIRTAVLVGDILPGTRITEREVKDLLHLSSSPIREAFHQLEAEGLLIRHPHVGTKVNDMDIGNTRELYLIQSLLQGMAVRISAQKLTEKDIEEAERLNREMRMKCRGRVDVKELRVANYKLHMVLCGINIHPWLTRLISALWIRFPTQSLWLVPNRPRLVIRQHENIIEAIKRKDERLAESSMREHLESSMKALYGPGKGV